MTTAVHHFGPDPKTIGGMASVIRVLTDYQVGADLVDCHATWTPASQVATARLAATAAVAVLRMDASSIAHFHLSERGSFIREGALVALAGRCKATTVVSLHGASFVRFAERHRRLVGSVLRCADLITCLDEESARAARGLAPVVRCEILPNPVAADDRPRAASETAELVVFGGELCLRKGADVLAEAWKHVASRRPASRCVMVGPEGDFDPPELDRMEVRSAVDPAAMREILRSARVIALPSRAEGMPMILTEAMSVGRPFVATPVGAIPELARAGGSLVPIDDAHDLAERLIGFLADGELARALGERGRQFCSETRSVAVVGERLRELYAEAARSKERR